MEILIKGRQSTDEASENLLSILNMFKDRYGVENFKEMRLEMVLMDREGDEVELVDATTSEVYRIFEVYRSDDRARVQPKTSLKLIVDNTKTEK